MLVPHAPSSPVGLGAGAPNQKDPQRNAYVGDAQDSYRNTREAGRPGLHIQLGRRDGIDLQYGGLDPNPYARVGVLIWTLSVCSAWASAVDFNGSLLLPCGARRRTFSKRSSTDHQPSPLGFERGFALRMVSRFSD